MTGIGMQGLGLTKGPMRVPTGLPIDDPKISAADQVPETAAVSEGLAVGSSLPGLGAQGVSGLPGLANPVSVEVVSPAKRLPEPESGSGLPHAGGGIQAVDTQTILHQIGDMGAVPTAAASSVQSVPAGSGSAPSVADQIAPAVVAMAQGDGGRLSISITPDQLGQVHITVERATDGITTIHVAAEQMATLEMLRLDQGSLSHALDQAGVGQQGHSLSFSWNGGGGTPDWGRPGGQSDEGKPTANPIGPYSAVSTPAVSILAAARGGIDVTA
jgi:hypothetical protein